jgi:hypothetical protein
MRHLQSFNLFESSSHLTLGQIKFLNDHTRGTWQLNGDGKVNVEGDFVCSGEDLDDLKGLRFGKVSVDFRCSNNNIKSLAGVPNEVGGDFWFANNRLQTLEGAPEKVGGDFRCAHNFIRSLVGSPREIGGTFRCDDNHLINLEGSPRSVGGDFSCSNNDLQTLDGSPDLVVGNFNCSVNDLVSLEGAPRAVGGRFNCTSNRLQTLAGAPEKIADIFLSDKINVQGIHWNIKNLIEMYPRVDDEKKTLLAGLVSPEALQKRIDENPERAAIELKSIAGLPEFRDLKWPVGLRTEVDLLADLDSVGL